MTAIEKRKKQWLEILKIAWPLIIANSFWNLQLTIDRIYLGSYSTESLAAAMAVMGIFWTPMALLQQTSGYVTTFVAQYFGAKENRMIGPAVWQAIYVSVVGGLLFLLLIPASEFIFTNIGHSPTVRDLEITYFKAICFSALPTALVAAFSGFFTGLGNTKVVMIINGSGLIVNALFDYLLIFGNHGFPAMGVAGAGYATAMANFAGAGIGFLLVFTRAHDKLYNLWRGWNWNLDLVRRYVRFGVPSGLQWALEGLAFTVFHIVIGRLKNGDAALASSSIAITVLLLAILPALGIGQAVMVLVGQHLGEKRPQQAETSTWSGLQLASAYMIMMGITFVLFPSFFLSWFQNEKNLALWTEVSNIVPYLFIYVAVFTIFDSANITLSFALKGAGDTKFASLVALIMPWPLMVLPTILVSDWNGAVYWAWGFSVFFAMCQAGVFLLRFMGGKWKSMSVIHG